MDQNDNFVVLPKTSLTCSPYFVYGPQIYKGDPRLRIPPRVMASSATGLKLGVFGFLPTTQAKTNAKTMRPRSLRTMQHFTRVSFSSSNCSRCRWHTQLTNHGYFDHRKNPKTPNLSPMPGLKMAQVLGSPVCICGMDQGSYIRGITFLFDHCIFAIPEAAILSFMYKGWVIVPPYCFGLNYCCYAFYQKIR